MNLIKYLSKDSVLLLEEEITRSELISKMCASFANSPEFAGNSQMMEKIEKAVIERELKGSTMLTNGFAFPHARVSDIAMPVVAIAVLKKPLVVETPDSQPLNFVCLAAAPEDNPTIALKIMSQICVFFANQSRRQKLLEAQSREDIYNFVKDAGINLDVPVTARDIMTQPSFQVTPDMPLRRLTHLMSVHGEQAVAVTSESGNMLGHITCAHLFHFGLPDFFSKLKSVSFISEFDPFEKYFYEEAHSKASNLMEESYLAVKPDTTLLEVVFSLTTLGHPKVYVLEKDHLLGVIDQGTVLDQIVNL